MARKSNSTGRFIGACVVLTIAVAIGWSSCGRREKLPEAPKAKPRASLALPLARTTVSPKASGAADENSEVPAPCRLFWDELRQVALDEVEERPETLLSLPRGERCRRVPAALKFWHERYAATCEKLSAENWEQGTRSQECFASFATYRAYVSDWLTRGRPLSDIDDTRVLADKLMVAYLSPGGAADTRGTTPLAAISMRLMERNPRSLPAAKAFLSALGDEGRTKWNERLWRRADRAIEIVASTNRDLPGFRAVARWVRTRGEEGAEVPGSVLQRLGGFSFLDFYSEKR